MLERVSSAPSQHCYLERVFLYLIALNTTRVLFSIEKGEEKFCSFTTTKKPNCNKLKQQLLHQVKRF